MPYLLEGISGHKLGLEVMNKTTHLKDLISWDANLTEFAIAELGLDGSIPIFVIGNDVMTIQLTNFLGKLAFDYAYITDPPILADIGEAFF